METQTISNETKQMTAIERALAAAKARKAAKSGEETSAEAAATKAPKVKAEKATDAERAAAKAQREAERATRTAAKAIKEAEMKAAKEARAAERAAKKAAKAAAASTERKPAHMKKVERARAKLPQLSTSAEAIFQEATTTLSLFQLEALSQHIALHVRAGKTAACTEPHKLGIEVRIVGGDTKFVGSVGKVVASNKLRVRVAVPGTTREVYLYACDVEPVAAATAAA